MLPGNIPGAGSWVNYACVMAWGWLCSGLQPSVEGSPFVNDDEIQLMLDELRVFKQVDFG